MIHTMSVHHAEIDKSAASASERLAFLPSTITATMIAVMFAAPLSAEPTTTIEVNVRLRTGGALKGLVVDHDSSGLVVFHEQKPLAFAWSELDPGAVFAVRRDLLAFERGGQNKLTAEDHFALGSIALEAGRNDLAGLAFRQVRRLDPSMNARIERAFAAFRERQRTESAGRDPFNGASANNHETPSPDSRSNSDNASNHQEYGPSEPSREQTPILFELVPREGWSSPDGPDLSSDGIRHRTEAAYRHFGEKVRELMGSEVNLAESDHFLIWTDFPPPERDRLAVWSEAMYAALIEQFSLDPTQLVFPAKCPIFCWRHKGKFRKFARLFDGYDARESIGYTRSLEQSGHSHVVLQRWGDSPVDANQLACTLIHEGTHAFVHRLYTTRLIPHWVNEGLAELTADRVLGDRCPAAAKATLLARAYVRYDWPIADMLNYAGPIDVDHYPLAHSVIAYLDGRGRNQLAAFIKNLKTGRSLAEALSGAYNGLTIEKLEADWRNWVKTNENEPSLNPTPISP
jgi:hypothetical protein